MKKLLLLICSLAICSGFLFAEEADEYESDFVYESNGAGDQYMRISLFANVPLNFNIDGQNKLYTGFSIGFGYYRFLNKWFAIGGEVQPNFNHTIANNDLTTVPFLFGAIFQPSAGKFEFPINIAAGFYYATSQNMHYFPGFVVKTSAGVYFRPTEIWSFGAECEFKVLPEFSKDASRTRVKTFITPGISARYHF